MLPHVSIFGRAALLVVVVALLPSRSHGAQLSESRRMNPVRKVLTLLSDLKAKVLKDGEAQRKSFEEYADWCKNGASDKEYEIKTAKADIEDLTATIEKAQSDISTLGSKVDDLATAITGNDADLKAASQIRQKEREEFAAAEKELVDSVDILERAINLLERKMQGSAMLQAPVNRKDVSELIHVLSTVVEATALSLHDKQRLLGLVQNNDDDSDEEDEGGLGAPAPEAYKAHSQSIVDVLEDLKQKAATQLEEARREEANAKHNFELMKQSLQDQIKVGNKNLDSAKTSGHEATETKADAEGGLSVATKSLEDSQNVLKNMKGDCMTAAQDHEASVTSRAEEVEAIGAAIKAIQDSTGDAESHVYSDVATLLELHGIHAGEVSSLQTRVDSANFNVVNIIRKMARDQKSSSLAQLAGRISAIMREGTGAGEDPFAKVKALITDMIARLQRDAGEEATHKAYCDKEMKDTKQKTEQLKYDIEKLSSRIDKAMADSAMDKDDVAVLNSELADIFKRQAQADTLRIEEHKVYVQTKSDLEQGLQGIRMGLKLLRDYYASEPVVLLEQPVSLGVHSKASGSGSGIIGMLEVVESDFGRNLASIEMSEETAATAYQRFSMENKVSRAMKDKDVKYKIKSAAALDKSAAEFSSDRASSQAELDAVLQYSTNIRGMCVLRPETYEERKGRREQEISGLREALEVLEGEAVLLQGRSHQSSPSSLSNSALRLRSSRASRSP